MTFDQALQFLGRHISGQRLMCTVDGNRLVVWAPVTDVSPQTIASASGLTELSELAEDVTRRARAVQRGWAGPAIEPGRRPTWPVREPEPDPDAKPESEPDQHDSAIRFSLLELD